jgi:4-hydroxy-3-polyprenylbenzoate decarboxylase
MILEKWTQGLENPIEPVIVTSDKAPVKQEIHYADELEGAGKGLEEFPIPISTPGFDPAPFLTSPYWVTKDPETGIRNVGTYRAMIKGTRRTGSRAYDIPTQHITIHWNKWKKLGRPMEAAIVIGGPPIIGIVSAAKIPYGVDEFSVAGGIIKEPIPLVRCETVDLEVPATAEIVIEGELSIDYVEYEGPFGEYTGYIGPRRLGPSFEVKCISHRKSPIYQAFISQFPPSESTTIKSVPLEATLFKLLRNDIGLPVIDVAFHEESGSWEFCVIQLKKSNNSQPWQALSAAAGMEATVAKIIIVVDEDVDPHDPDSVIWALCYAMQPHLDIRILPGKAMLNDPSGAPPEASYEEQRFPKPTGGSRMLIDATRKWAYPPISLPAKEYMENALAIWKELGLPQLKPKKPWFGTSLGYWFEENVLEADLALKGRYYETGEKLAREHRVNV